MKNILLCFAAILICALLISTPLFAEENEISDPFADFGIVEGFEGFAGDVAKAMPFYSMIGLQWSHAHIGQLLRVPPNIGVGVTLGATNMPLEALTKASQSLGKLSEGSDLDLLAAFPDEVRDLLESVGVPLPAALIEARIGGFILPFDIGFKFSSINEPMDVDFSTMLVGGDIRYRVIRGRLGLPTVSVGAGINHTSGNISLGELFGQDISLDSVSLPDPDDWTQTRTYDLSLSDPTIGFNWASTVVDFKVQASSNLLIFTPYIGAGLSRSKSTAGGGILTEIVVSEDDTPLGPEDVEKLQAAYDEAREQNPGLPAVQFSGDQGISVQQEIGAWDARIFGGASINLFMLKIDLGAMYGLLSGSFGGSIGMRIQL
ncbi:hypothetical protein [Spirochaeta dissipatitropha]